MGMKDIFFNDVRVRAGRIMTLPGYIHAGKTSVLLGNIAHEA